MKVGSGSPSNFGSAESTGTLTGTLTQDFTCPGSVGTCAPSYFWRVGFTITLAGRCPATLSGTDNASINGDPFVGNSEAQFNGKVSGTTCNGPANGVAFNMCRAGSFQCQ